MSFEERIAFFEPTKENVLLIIKHDPNAFGTKHILKIMQMPKNDPSIDKMISLFLELNELGYVKAKGLTNDITFKGRFYLLVKKDAWAFWGIVIAIVTALIGWVIAVF